MFVLMLGVVNKNRNKVVNRTVFPNDQTMLRYNIDKNEKTDLLGKLYTDNNEYKDWLKKGVDLLSNFKKHYQHSNVEQKQQLLGSIFPEKLDFDGNKCRTIRINEVLGHILLIDNKIKSKKKGTDFK
jgi:site-specific DNA recombinase